MIAISNCKQKNRTVFYMIFIGKTLWICQECKCFFNPFLFLFSKKIAT